MDTVGSRVLTAEEGNVGVKSNIRIQEHVADIIQFKEYDGIPVQVSHNRKCYGKL